MVVAEDVAAAPGGLKVRSFAARRDLARTLTELRGGAQPRTQRALRNHVGV